MLKKMNHLFSVILSLFLLFTSVLTPIRAEGEDPETEPPVETTVVEEETEIMEEEPVEIPEESVEEPEEVIAETEEPAEEIPEEVTPEEETPAEEVQEEETVPMADGQTVTVTYELPEGATLVIDGQTVTGTYTYTVTDYDGSIFLPEEAPEKPGYVFWRWNVTANGKSQGNNYYQHDAVDILDCYDGVCSVMEDENISVICVPEFNRILSFSVSYHLNMEGATLGDSSEAVITRSYENKTEGQFNFPRPYKQGKEYLGWAFEETATTSINIHALFQAVEAGNTSVDLYAVWTEATTYEVIYNVNPEEGYLYLDETNQPVYQHTDYYCNDIQLWHPWATFLYPKSTVPGKIFAGWEYDTETSDDDVDYPGRQIWFINSWAIRFDENNQHIRTALWADGETYTLRLHLNGGTLSNRSEYVSDFTMDGDTALVPITQFDVDQGMVLPTSGYNTFDVKWPIENNGRDLKGWSTEAEPSETTELYENLGDVFDEAPAADIDLYAVWDEPASQEQTYTVIYNLNGGTLTVNGTQYTETYSEEVEAGTPYELKGDIVREGYTFDNYDLEISGNTLGTIQPGELLENYDIYPEAGSTLTVNARWWQNLDFTIRYVINLESAVFAETGTSEDILVEKNTSSFKLNGATPTSATMHFTGWGFTPEDTVGVQDLDEIRERVQNGETEITLYAIWEENEPSYTVRYVLGEGESWIGDTPQTEFVLSLDESHECITNIPQTKGKDFGYWSVRKQSDPDTELCTLNEGVSIDPAEFEIENGDVLILTAGWWNKVGIIWYNANAENAYIISEDVSSGELVQHPGGRQRVTYAEMIQVGITAVRENYTLAGWALDPNGEVVYKDGEKVPFETLFAQGSSVDLYAVWADKTYTVSFYLNKGTLEGYTANSKGLVKATVSAEQFASLVPVRNGYTFTGWYSDSKLKKQVTPEEFAALPKNMTLYAGWTGNEYYVILHANSEKAHFIVDDVSAGGQVETESDYISAVFGKESVITSKPVRAGFTFKGWATTPESTDIVYKNGTKYKAFAEAPGNYSCVDLYAVWSKNTYKITYNLKGGSIEGLPVKKNVSTETYTVEEITTIKTPTRNGYIFAGWFTDSKCKKEYAVASFDPENAPANLTLYAKWTAKSYKINYVLNVSDKSALPYYDQEKYGDLAAVFVAGTENATYENELNRTGVDATVDGFVYNKKQKMTVKGGVRGLTFLGWSRDPNATTATYKAGKSYKNYSPDGEDVTLYAVWKKTTYTIKFNLNKGSIEGYTAKNGVVTVKYDVYTPPFDLIRHPEWYLYRDGYTLTPNWFKDSKFTKPLNMGDFNRPMNLTLYAQWTPNHYIVELKATDVLSGEGFKQEDGTYTDTMTLDAVFNKKMAIKAVPVRQGYTFKGWAVSESDYEAKKVTYKKGTKYAKFASDPLEGEKVTLYAVWEPVKYTIKINANGGKVDGLKVSKGVAKTTYTCENMDAFRYLFDPEVYTRTGYTFDGLYEDKALKTPFDPDTHNLPFTNITVYVKWVKQ
ncbi:MAG: InlB B-repeat-containing protein [Solobacterium sp.]|nr:InlB B-repeat-containing protein [Solobacterium sp.]